MTWKLGLTGSIGMGKSTTAEMFRDEGIPVWDADEVVHRLYANRGAAVAPLAGISPGLIENGEVSRAALKRLIADDPRSLAKIEAIVHPLVAADRQRFMAQTDAEIVVLDIPLLYETGADAWLDSVLVVTAPPEIQRARVLARPGMTPDHLDLILSRQMPDAEKRARADHIIETLSLDGARAAVRHLIETLKSRRQDA